ncbi:hypothetical protein [Kordiimonas marina]|uniref:hypothetical protein n=1 Tax=Kordiimonas marina TaxID=2872312 RepID=UPI001FF5BA23|nr:hypothetical protein [Kordiimonas marina]MCJ9430758.1 hypothetical protein [Kordiimonas marina]
MAFPAPGRGLSYREVYDANDQLLDAWYEEDGQRLTEFDGLSPEVAFALYGCRQKRRPYRDTLLSSASPLAPVFQASRSLAGNRAQGRSPERGRSAP